MGKPTELLAKAAENVVDSVVQGTSTAKAGVAMTLFGISYTLQEIASIVSIIAGITGVLYSLHLIAKFWWDNLWKPIIKRNKPSFFEDSDDERPAN